MIGLALSIASISAAFTRSQLSQELLSLQARARGLEWIGLLQSGDAENAFKMTTASRQGAPAAPGEPPAEPAAAPIDTFRADPVVNFLLTRAAAAPVQYDRDTAFDLASGYDARIQQLFTVAEPASSGGASPTAIEIILQRVRGYDGAPSEWDVAAYKSDDVTSHP